MRFILIFSFIVFSFSLVAQPLNGNSRKLAASLYAVSSLYVDSVNDGKLVEDAITGMLEKLDPHSNYLTVEEVKEMNEPLQGNFDGIGVQFNMLTDTLYVVQVIPGGPSEKVGIRAGDRIVMVNDSVIAGVKMKNTDIMKRLRGPKGTTVRVKVLRQNIPELIEFKIVRDKIPINSLDAAYMAGKEIGYIKLNRFGATTHKEFLDALTDLKKKGMKKLILDLQGNGGGYLNAAIDLADEFLGNKELIVYTEGRKSPREEAVASAKGAFEKGALVVLIDEYSASASEIVSGAIQDWDRGVLVGRRSFGKGLVQRPIPLPDGSMLRLTTARYYTPTGRSIQKPYVKGDKESYEHEMIDRYKRGELMSADSISFADSLKFYTLVNKREVYGGGGIMPDLFVPIDTTKYTDYHRDLVAKGALMHATMNYIDKNRELLKKEYSSFEKFQQNFKIEQSLFDDLFALAREEKIEDNPEEFERSKGMISLQMKALIARDLFDMQSYYEVINQQNEDYQKALEILKTPALYQELIEGKK
ncbi:MAG: S41 family peptidase [Bacteroidales bacterium]|nr:S41 family peptidase [Bacteroidales bacterium]